MKIDFESSEVFKRAINFFIIQGWIEKNRFERVRSISKQVNHMWIECLHKRFEYEKNISFGCSLFRGYGNINRLWLIQNRLRTLSANRIHLVRQSKSKRTN